MNSICKKCITKGDKKWIPISINEYYKFFERLPWLKNNYSKENVTILKNISSQLQLIEVIDKVNQSCDFQHNDCSYDTETDNNFDTDSEIEQVLIKQQVCVIGAILEAVCYVLITAQGISISKSTKWGEMLKIISERNLLPQDEISLCSEIKSLRNRVHLIRLDSDVDVFSRNESDSAKMCLYFLLKSWLSANETLMEIYFYYIPKASKKILPFTF